MAKHEDYASCATYEQHFNNLQTGIRGLASAWILAACAGFSTLLLQTADSKWLLPPAVLLALMCFMGTVGLALLWLLDLFVYQKLLGSIFLTGLRMEQLNPTLPPARALMVHAFEQKGASRIIQTFYIIPAALFALVTLAVRLLVLTNPLTPNQGQLILVLFVCEVAVV